MASKDGGPAFPTFNDPGSREWHCGQTVRGGMSLRDWFAGQAVGDMADYIYDCVETGDMETAEAAANIRAKAAYVLADAMLAEREKGGA